MSLTSEQLAKIYELPTWQVIPKTLRAHKIPQAAILDAVFDRELSDEYVVQLTAELPVQEILVHGFRRLERVTHELAEGLTGFVEVVAAATEEKIRQGKRR